MSNNTSEPAPKPVYDEVTFSHIKSVEERMLEALERIETLFTNQLYVLQVIAKLQRGPEEVLAEKASAKIAARNRR